MWGEQALARREHRALPVAFNRTALKHEVVVVKVFAFDRLVGIEAAVDGVVEVGRKLVSPAVEAEVKQPCGTAVRKAYEAMVACPSVVRWATVQRYVDDDTVAGIVITHGTDSMEETAYFLHLTVDTDKPVVLTGSMRPATAISADGPLNLLMAVQTVRAEASRGKGIIVALNGYLDCAREVTKLHTTDVATFGNDYFGHMGLVQDGIPFYYYEPLRRHTKYSEFARLGEQTLPQVEILYLYGGIKENFVAAVLSQRLDGLVVAGLGHGIIPQRIQSQLSSLTIPIVRASKTGHGMVSPMKNDGLHDMVAADTLTPVKARILLMLGLTKTRHVDELQSMFGTY